ncbi:MAG: hypothetical protein GKR96_00150 [Gammaproteobacteria bacterium]|nr:hypothetical protein [Gammaproteobacteria bacterium]
MSDELESAHLADTLKDEYNAIREKAFGLLARREHSEFELRSKLCPLASPMLIDELIGRLIQKNIQSDLRFAEMLCRSRFNQGKGPLKLYHELSQNQIDSCIVEQVMKPYEDGWRDLAKQVREKKFGTAPVDNYREWARQARFLQQRGFNASHFDDFAG